MTKTALENKKLEQEKLLQEKQQQHEVRENRKKNLYNLAGSALKLFSPVGKIGKAAEAASQVASRFRKNDAQWYKRYLIDLDKFTNVATYHRLGTSSAGFYTIGQIGSNTVAIPGIMAFPFYDVIGSNVTSASETISKLPINQILMRTKEQILKSNSRSSVPWEASDMGYNIICATSILSSICDAERALYIAQTYKADNAYLARSLLEAAGWDSTAVFNNLANFRQYLTLIKARFNSSIALPNILSYVSRKIFLNSNVFADSNSKTAQMFIFRCENWFRLSDDGASVISMLPDRSSPLNWFNQVSLLIQSLVENPDFQAMFADLRSAVTDFVTLDTAVDENAQLSLIIDENFRSQIENMQTLPAACQDMNIIGAVPVDLTIRQDNNGYLYQGAEDKKGLLFRITTEDTNFSDYNNMVEDINDQHFIGRTGFFNMHKEDINGDDILEISRFKFLAGASTESGGSSDHVTTITISNSGTEIVKSIIVYALTYSGALYNLDFATDVYVDNTSVADIQTILTMISYITAFDWSPMTRVVYTREVRPIVDYDVPFTVANANIASINDACTLSMFYLDTSIFKR